MARAAVRGRLGERLRWRTARLVATRDETASARTLVLDVEGWPGHLAGQHVDVRLTADDGYTAQRSYSIASAVDGERVELTVQRVPDGEVSPYLVGGLEVGQAVELRGPVGGWFAWEPGDLEPVLLVGGGSGLVPLMAMLRARQRARSSAPFRLLVSVRTPADLLYAEELAASAREPDVRVVVHHTREAPAGSPAPQRLSSADVAAVAFAPEQRPLCFVCGPTGFVEAVATALVDAGHPAEQVRTERFGPSGG
ncbi:ferredoxin reductase [Angustibacter peucedani]